MTPELRELARVCGVQTAYRDVRGQRRQAGAEGITGALQALGAPLPDGRDARFALRHTVQAAWQQALEPVLLAWDGAAEPVALRLPASAGEAWEAELKLETGEVRRWSIAIQNLPEKEAARVEGCAFVRREWRLPEPVPPGYHRLTLQTGARPWEALLISAPRRACSPQTEGPAKPWGVFLPLYALRRSADWGLGDFSGLRELGDWVRGLGGDTVGTLPLMACYLDQPFEPSPYSPVSRLFWNELYLDVERLPELENSRAGQALVNSGKFQEQLRELRKQGRVDYRLAMVVKRRALGELSRSLWETDSPRRAELQRYLAAHPLLEHYAKFRAEVEQRGATQIGGARARSSGSQQQAESDKEIRQYHAYVQWAAQEQISQCSGKSAGKGQGMYLDLPLGVHREGFDPWHFRESFALEASGGAPPDSVFTRGQDWQFPPLHPARIRQSGYRYFRHCIRHLMQQAGVLRIDHIMGFHRLFWVPAGLPASQGVYVRYRPEEFYAVVTLESMRNRTVVVGEDLGTVLREVRATMARHGILRSYIVQEELRADSRGPLRPVPRESLVAVNTHDMPMFTRYWQGGDIANRIRLGLLPRATVRAERARRGKLRRGLLRLLSEQGLRKGQGRDAVAVHRALLRWLGGSRGCHAMVNLEDLWGEPRPQNVPGTGGQQPNWRRKARHGLEKFANMRKVSDALRELDAKRKGKSVK